MLQHDNYIVTSFKKNSNFKTEFTKFDF